MATIQHPQDLRAARNRITILATAPGARVLGNRGGYSECQVLEILEKHGDHAIVVFEVLNAVLRRDIAPLTVTGSPWQYGG
jgi:hypothetical protein